MVVFSLLILSSPAFAATKVWNSSAAWSNASNATNWLDGVVPVNGDDVIFNDTGTGNCTWDLTVNVTWFNITSTYNSTINQTSVLNITNYNQSNGTFTQGGNVSVNGTTTISGGTLTGSTSYWWLQNGDITKTAGTVTNYGLNMIIGGNTNVTTNSNFLVNNLTINTGYTFTLLTTSAGHFVTLQGTKIYNTSTLSIGSGRIYYDYTTYQAGGSFTNNGTISGLGTMSFRFAFASPTITFGTITAPVAFADSGMNANRTVTLGANTVFGSTLSFSLAAYSLTLSHGSNYALEVTGLTTLGANATMTQGTGLWNFSGGYTQSGSGSLFTQGGNIEVRTANFTISAGTFTGSTSYNLSLYTNLSYNSGATASIGSNTVNLVMKTDGNTIGGTSTAYFWIARRIIIEGNTTFSQNCQFYTGGLNVSSGKLFNITVTGQQFLYQMDQNLGIGNLGTITGVTGSTFSFYGNTAKNLPSSLGTYTVPTTNFSIPSWSTANRTWTMTGNLDFGGKVNIFSGNTSNYLTLSHGSNYMLNSSGLFTLGTNGIMTQGTGLWNFSGGYTQSGSDSTFTQGGNVSVTGNTTISAGTLTGNTSYNWIVQNFTATGGSMTASTINLVFNGTNRWLTMMTAPFRYAQVNTSSDLTAGSDLQVDNLTLVGNLTLTTARVLNNTNLTMLGGNINITNGTLNNNIVNGTTFNLNGTNITLMGTGAYPADTAGLHNIGKYINITNQTAIGSYGLNISYATADYGTFDENSIRLYQWDGSAWIWLISTVDVTNNFITGYGLSSFGIIAPMASEPVWSSNISSTPSTYSNSTYSTFNITWNGNISSAWLESNYSGSATNYSMSAIGSVYGFGNILSAGTFYWKSYANDTQNVWNTSITWNFTIGKANNPLNFTFSPSGAITYPNTTSVECYAYDSTPTLYLNDLSLSNQTNDSQQLGVGAYQYICNITSSTNYTSNTTFNIFTIIQNTSTGDYLNLTINGTESNKAYQYPTGTNATAWNSVAEITFVLKRNTTVIGSGIDDLQLGAGYYIYNYSFDGNENYSEAWKSYTLTLTKITANSSIYVTPLTPITQGTPSTALCYEDSGESTAILYRNGTDVTATENDTAYTLSTGKWLYQCYVQATQNYTSYTASTYYTVIANSSGGTTGFSNVTILNPKLLRFDGLVDFNNQALVNVGQLCLGGVCRNSWASVTLVGSVSSPSSCDISTEGGLFYNSSSHHPCYCNGSNWLSMTDATC